MPERSHRLCIVESSPGVHNECVENDPTSSVGRTKAIVPPKAAHKMTPKAPNTSTQSSQWPSHRGGAQHRGEGRASRKRVVATTLHRHQAKLPKQLPPVPHQRRSRHLHLQVKIGLRPSGDPFQPPQGSQSDGLLFVQKDGVCWIEFHKHLVVTPLGASG